MKQEEKDFFAENIKSGAEIIADGAIFCFRIEEEINKHFPKLFYEQQEKLKTKIILMSATFMLIYEIDRKHLETKISYGRNFSKQDKEETINYISRRFSIDSRLAKKQIKKNIKLFNSLGKIEKKTPEDLEKRVRKLLDSQDIF